MEKLKYNGQDVWIDIELDENKTGVKLVNNCEDKPLEQTMEIPKIEQEKVGEENA